MKLCPLCNRTYSEEDFNYCPIDGAILPASTVTSLPTLNQSNEISSPAQHLLEDVILPHLGDAVSKATITKWHKNVGEAVKRDEALYDISTNKVDAEIPSPQTGVLFEIRVHVGQTVPVNTVIARIRCSNDSK